jgi:hypothetical protein
MLKLGDRCFVPGGFLGDDPPPPLVPAIITGWFTIGGRRMMFRSPSFASCGSLYKSCLSITFLLNVFASATSAKTCGS